MKTSYPCAGCQFTNTARSLDLIDITREKKEEISRELFKIIEEHRDGVPAHIATKIHRKIKQSTGVEDPFAEWKRKSVGMAMRATEDLQVHGLKDAIKLAIGANIIDFTSIKEEQELSKLQSAMQDELFVDDYEKLEKLIAGSKTVLYLTDNCGEHIFDKILIDKLEQRGLAVTAAGKGGPIVNDATYHDLKNAGIKKVISMGTDCVGTKLDEVSPEFKEAWQGADFIIAKGMANYECLEDYRGGPIVFMLRAKCDPVSWSLGVPKGSNVLKVINFVEKEAVEEAAEEQEEEKDEFEKIEKEVVF